MVVGVGIGGTFEKAACMAKEALTRNVKQASSIPYVRELEEEMLEKINHLGHWAGGAGRKDYSSGGKYQYVSDTYCGTSGGSKYLLSCEPSCSAGDLRRESMDRYIKAPLCEEDAKSLRAGDYVYITGTIYTARDAAHKRMQEALDEGRDLPFDIRGNIIYYMGPSPAREGRPIGSAGPTTASRMDKYAPKFLDLGLRGMIGKGKRTKEVQEAIVKMELFTLQL